MKRLLEEVRELSGLKSDILNEGKKISKSMLNPVIKALAGYISAHGAPVRIQQRRYKIYIRARNKFMDKIGVSEIPHKVDNYIDREARKEVSRKVVRGPGADY